MSEFVDMPEWAVEATRLFHRYREELQQALDEGMREFALLAAGKAEALDELLSKFGHRPFILTK